MDAAWLTWDIVPTLLAFDPLWSWLQRDPVAIAVCCALRLLVQLLQLQLVPSAIVGGCVFLGVLHTNGTRYRRALTVPAAAALACCVLTCSLSETMSALAWAGMRLALVVHDEVTSGSKRPKPVYVVLITLQGLVNLVLNYAAAPQFARSVGDAWWLTALQIALGVQRGSSYALFRWMTSGMCMSPSSMVDAAISAAVLLAARAHFGPLHRINPRAVAPRVRAGPPPRATNRPPIATATNVTVRNKPATQERECCICLEQQPVVQGVLCHHPQPAARHFTCVECFSNHVRHSSQADLDLLERRGGKIKCAAHECPSEAFTDFDVFRNINDDAIQAYQAARERLKEKQVVEEMEPVVRQRVRAEIQAETQFDGEQRVVAAARRHIIDQILTCACPRCSQAFVDFDGCCALTCNRCAGGFCAYCLEDCGADAHPHVARCQFGVGTFASEHQFQECRRRWMTETIREYMERHVDREMQGKVADACRQELVDLGLNAVLQQFARQAPHQPRARAARHVEELDYVMALHLQYDDWH